MTFTENKEALELRLSQLNSEEERVTHMLSYCCFNKIRKWKECTAIAEEALNISRKINYQEGIGLSLLELGYQCWFSDNLKEGYAFLEKSSNILIETNNYFKYSRALAVKASILWSNGDRKEAIEKVFNGLRHVKRSNIPANGLWLDWFLGIFYFDLKDYSNSEKQYLKALDFIKNSQISTRDAYAYCLIGYGNVLLHTNREEQALEYFSKAKDYSKKEGLWMQEARVLHDLGNYYKRQRNIVEAKKYFFKSYDIRNVQNTKPALITSLLSLATLEINDNIDLAVQYGERALHLSKTIGAKQKIKSSHSILSTIYKIQNNISLSYNHLEKANSMEAQFSGEKFSSELKNIETKFISELLQREAQILLTQNDELRKANEIIKRQYQEISDSIQYAKRIQTAILPPHKLVKEYLNDSFIIYLPKDVVAGDFYWIQHIENSILFAVADCTGHGVPGAMISVVCNNILNRVIREFKFKKPSDILNKVRELILIEFKSEDKQFYEGMDISLCALDLNLRELNWAGANSPIWVLRKDKNVIIEIKGDKQPIGRYINKKPFTNHQLSLRNGDIIYIFSDGYADQFGGEFNKKMMRKNFKKNIYAVSHLPMSEQRSLLINQFKEWMGTFYQIDDVCVIGVKV